MIGNGFRIRAATPEDTGTITELWKELMDFHQERDSCFTRSANGHERFAEFVSGRILSETACVLVAEQQGRIVGYCLAAVSKFPPVFEHQEYGAISDLAVSAPWRRGGIGQALVAAALRWFAARAIHRIEVRVAISNEVSTAFWEKMGFAPYLEIMSQTI